MCQPLDQPLAVVAGHAIGQRGQVLHVADQVRQAELHLHVEASGGAHVFAICREVVGPDHAGEGLAQRLDEHVRAARGIDLEEREPLAAEAPRPELFAALLVAGLIDVQVRLLG